MAVPLSRDLCFKEAMRTYERKVLKICGQIDSDLRSRGFGQLSTSPFLAGVWDSIGEITDAVVECDKASASRQLARIRETGTVAERSPFHKENADLLKKCIAVTIEKIPTLLKAAHRLMRVDFSSRSRAYADREEQRIELEYQALENEFRKDIDAAIQAHRQSHPSPTISESPTVVPHRPPKRRSQTQSRGGTKPQVKNSSGGPKGITRTDAALELQSMADDDQTDSERSKAASEMSQKWLKRRTIKWPSAIGIDPNDRIADLFDVAELVTVLADAERGAIIKYGGEKKLVGKLRKKVRESLSVAECIAIRARRATRTTRTSAKSKKTSPAKTPAKTRRG